MTDEHKIANRIRKLIEKAESSNYTGEAEALMENVRRLMDKHNLSEVDLEKLRDEDPIGGDNRVFVHRVNDSWMFDLSSAVAHYFGCRVVRTSDLRTKHTKYISVFGSESARAVVAYMVPYVRTEVLRRGAKLYEENPYTYKSINAARRSLANAMIGRIQKMCNAREGGLSEAQRGNELIVVDAVDSYIKDVYPTLKEAKHTHLSTHAKSAKEARKIGLFEQLKHHGTKSGRLSGALPNFTEEAKS